MDEGLGVGDGVDDHAPGGGALGHELGKQGVDSEQFEHILIPEWSWHDYCASYKTNCADLNL